MSPSGYTPSTRRYYEVVATTVMPNIKYRCQKSYVVMMSDGDANLSCSFSAGPEFHHRFNYDGNNNWSNERNGAYRMTYYNYNVYNAARGQSCRKSSRCLHHRLRKINLQDLKRCRRSNYGVNDAAISYIPPGGLCCVPFSVVIV